MMKFYPLALMLVIGLALAGCHRGLYSATAEIKVRTQWTVSPITPLGPDGNARPPFAADMESLQSDDVLLPVIQKLNLSSTWAKRFGSDHPVLSGPEALDHIRKVLRIDLVSGTNLINITAYSEVPQEAADIANAVADGYKAIRDREEAIRLNRGLDALREQIAQQQEAAENSKAASAKSPDDVNARRGFEQQQAILDALNNRLKQVLADQQFRESPVRIISRAVAPPE